MFIVLSRCEHRSHTSARARLSAALIATVALCTWHCASASASGGTWFGAQAPQTQQAIVDTLYDNSPVAVTPYGGAAAAEAAAIDGGLTSLAADTAVGQDVGGSLWRLLGKFAFVPEMGPAIPEADVIAGTFEVGWLMGTGARKMFISLRADGVSGGSWSWGSVYWYPHGYDILYGATVQQTPGAYLYDSHYAGDRYFPARWFDAPCRFSGFTPPSGAHLETHVASTANCYEPPNY